MNRFKIRKPLAGALVTAAVLLAIPYALIVWVESESGQRFIERRAFAATGREIKIGDIDVKVGLTPGARQMRTDMLEKIPVVRPAPKITLANL